MNFAQLLRTHPRYLSFGFLHYFFSFIGQTFFISLFVAGISAERGWETDVFSGIYSTVTLVAAFCLPIIGRQIDRFRVRYVSTVTAAVMVIGCLILAFTYHWLWLAVGILAVRLGGQGVLALTGSTTIGRFFVAGRGKALSISMVGICFAEIVIPPLATTLIAGEGYRTMWLVAAGMLAVIFLPLIWWLIDRNDLFQKAETVAAASKEEQGASWTRGEVLGDRRFQLIVPTLLFIPFVFTGFVFNQSVVAEMRDYTVELMAIGLSVYGFVRMITLFTAGFVVDRLGPGRVLTFLLIPATIGIGFFVLFPTTWAVPVLFSLTAISAGMMTVTVPALWAERYGPRFLGAIKSAVGLLVVLSSAAAPIVFTKGLSFGVSEWMLVMVGYAVVCMLLTGVERGIKAPKVY
jgi:MFS family permease